MNFVVSLRPAKYDSVWTSFSSCSKKDSSISLSPSRFRSIGGLQAVRPYMCVNFVSFGDFVFYFDLCSLWLTGPSV